MDKHADDELAMVTKVERQPKNRHRYNIYLNDEYAFSVHEDILVKHRILKGEAIRRDTVREAVKDDERHQSYLEAIRMLGRRPRSKHETRTYLIRKGYGQQMVDETIKRLEREGLLDDEDFAKRWTEYRVISQRKGRRMARMELATKGVAEEEIETALAQIGVEVERAGALEAARKKWPTLSGEVREKQRKLLAFLLRRGFAYDLALDVTKEMAGSGNEDGPDGDWT